MPLTAVTCGGCRGRDGCDSLTGLELTLPSPPAGLDFQRVLRPAVSTPGPGPYYDEYFSGNVTVLLGTEATLNCRVKQASGVTVSPPPHLRPLAGAGGPGVTTADVRSGMQRSDGPGISPNATGATRAGASCPVTSHHVGS